MSNTTKLATTAGIPITDQPISPTRHRPLASPVRSLRKRGRRVRWGRLARRLCYAVALLVVTYLVVANVLLRTRLLRNAVSGSAMNFAVTGNSSELRLDYESAYSIVPGRVHLEGLTIRGRERTVEWALTLDHAVVDVSLVDLLSRKFHATRLRGSGFTIRARLRLDRAAATPEVVAALPSITGFADPPLLDGEPAPPPLTDATYKLWMVDLEDVDVEHVREVWVHTVRSEGDTHVYGRWLFRPQRWLEVGPAAVDANGVDISYGSHPLATGVHGSIGATVHPFDLRVPKGLALFDHVSTTGQMHGRAIVASALGLLLPRSGVGFTRMEGPFDAHVFLDHGRFADRTRVRFDTTDCEIEAEGLTFAAPIGTELGVDGDTATLDARVTGLRVSHLGVEQARVASIAAIVTSRRLRLADALDDARFSIDVGGAETSDVAAWRRYLPSTSPVDVRSGVVTAGGHADGAFAGGWAVGVATITADDVTARLGPALLAGKVAVHVNLRRGAWASRTFDLSGSDVVLRAVSAKSARSAVTLVDVPQLTVAAPRLAFGPSGVDGHVTIDLPRADLVHLGGLGELLPLPKGLGIEDGRGRARFHADVELGSGSMRGDGEVVARGVRGRVGSTELFGDLDCAVKLRRTGSGGWTDLSGSTLAVTRAGTGNGPPSDDAWWANLVLREATLRTSGGLRFDAKAHLAAKDASPATVLVSENTAVPTWAANVFRMPVLDADAQVRVAPSSLEVRSLVARGGSTSVRAEYAKRDGRQVGAVLLDLGWIDLGYDLSDGATGLVLVGPQGWYERKTGTMRDAAAAARRKADAAEQLDRYAALTPALRKEEARALAARCRLEMRSCDGESIENLLRTAADATEHDALSGITYAPMVVAAAQGGADGATLDPLVVGSVAEALKAGGESTLAGIPSLTRVAAATDSVAARGKVIAVTGRVAAIRREGPYAVGTLTTDAEPVYFVTPFATRAGPETLARFRGVFVQRYESKDDPYGQPPSLVLVGAFGP